MSSPDNGKLCRDLHWDFRMVLQSPCQAWRRPASGIGKLKISDLNQSFKKNFIGRTDFIIVVNK
jgi:hypothetical protein